MVQITGVEGVTGSDKLKWVQSPPALGRVFQIIDLVEPVLTDFGKSQQEWILE